FPYPTLFRSRRAPTAAPPAARPPRPGRPGPSCRRRRRSRRRRSPCSPSPTRPTAPTCRSESGGVMRWSRAALAPLIVLVASAALAADDAVNEFKKGWPRAQDPAGRQALIRRLGEAASVDAARTLVRL